MKLWRLGTVLAGYLVVMISMNCNVRVVNVGVVIQRVVDELPHSQGAPKSAEWPVTAGDSGGMRYSPLKEINASNVNQLQVAWTYDVGDGAGTLETNRWSSTACSTDTRPRRKSLR